MGNLTKWQRVFSAYNDGDGFINGDFDVPLIQGGHIIHPVSDNDYIYTGLEGFFRRNSIWRRYNTPRDLGEEINK